MTIQHFSENIFKLKIHKFFDWKEDINIIQTYSHTHLKKNSEPEFYCHSSLILFYWICESIAEDIKSWSVALITTSKTRVQICWKPNTNEYLHNCSLISQGVFVNNTNIVESKSHRGRFHKTLAFWFTTTWRAK